MNNNSITEMISIAMPLLSKWRGGRAKLWEYSVTHTKLTIRVESPLLSGNLHIICGGCKHYRGPFTWQNCDLFICHKPEDDSEITLIDEKIDFELRCVVLSVEENVEPVCFPNMGITTE